MRRIVLFVTVTAVAISFGAFVGYQYARSQGPGVILYQKKSAEGTADCPGKGPEYCGYEEQRVVVIGDWTLWVDNQKPSAALNVRDRHDTQFSITKSETGRGLGRMEITRLPFDLDQTHQPVLLISDPDDKGSYSHIAYSAWIGDGRLLIAKDVDMNGVVDDRVILDSRKPAIAPR